MAMSAGDVFAAIRATGPSRTETLARLDALSRLLDNAFVVPGTRIRFGLDGIVGLVPVVGDLISAVLSGYIIWEARQLGLPRWKIARMMGNVAFDTAIGIVPFVGDVADVMFKANRRNLKIVREHLAKEGVTLAERPPAAARDGQARGGTVIDAEYRVVRP